MQLSRAIKMVVASTLFAFVSYGVSITFFPHIKFVAEMQSILFSIYMWSPQGLAKAHKVCSVCMSSSFGTFFVQERRH